MPRLALKPDSSFFRKIAIGAVGTREVQADLTLHGHKIVELERGALTTKLWKSVKRKRVRIPDLLCLNCGLRIESRAKTKTELAMSHSPGEIERAWDFGMVNQDWIAFPVCEAARERHWSSGRLDMESSYWHERNWVNWQRKGQINYFDVISLRAVPHSGETTKGVTEGSETSISWPTMFANFDAFVESIGEKRITLQNLETGRRNTRHLPDSLKVWVSPGEEVKANRVLASVVKPLMADQLCCTGKLPVGQIDRLISSRERTQRFTGVKLARLRTSQNYCDEIQALAYDPEEDFYIRLEAVSYLASVCNRNAAEEFDTFLKTPDEPVQLEAIIALGETATPNAIALLCSILDDTDRPYFMRSAAAWSLSQIKSDNATERLVQAFTDMDQNIREEALEGIVSLGGTAVPILLTGLSEVEPDIAAGCAEALRQYSPLPDATLPEIVRLAEQSQWAVWLLGHLPRERVVTLVDDLRDSKPSLHYAVTLLWSFIENWIARRWELSPYATFTRLDEDGDV